MLDRLPAELGVRIVEQAAQEFRYSHRQSAVNLAASTKSIYAIVAPILYHTMIVMRKPQAARILSFMTSNETRSLAVRVCSYVRVLYHSIGIPRSVDPSLFVSLVRSYALGDVTRDAMQGALAKQASIDVPCSLRHVQVFSVDFAKELTEFPEYARATITHATGFLPIFSGVFTEWVRFRDTPKDWTHEIMDSMPALTHLGLVLINVDRQLEDDCSVVHFNFDALRTVIETALQCSRLQQVALRIGGRYIEGRPQDIERLLQQVTDQRFRVWRDERSLFSWDDWNERTCEDVLAGRDIWTETQVL